MTRHVERIRTSLGGRQSGIVLVDDLEQGLDVVNAYAAEHLEIQTADARVGRGPGPQRRRDLRRLVRAGLAGRLLRRLQPRAADRRLRLPLLGAVGARVPQGGARRRLHPRRRWPRSPTTSSPSPRPRTCPATVPPSARVSTAEAAMTPPRRGRRCARSCAAWSRTARRSSTCRSSSTSTRTPTRRRRRSSPTSRPPSPRRPTTLNRYPDREFTELRTALAAYLGHGVTPDQVWAANGSNEVMLQLLQAFGGPGRVALSFAPTYSMYPEYARDTVTEWVVGHRETDFSLDLDHARDAGARAAAERRAAAVAEQPDRHRAAARGGDRRCARPRRATSRRAGRRRRGVRRVPPRRHPQRARAAARSTATWSSPAP